MTSDRSPSEACSRATDRRADRVTHALHGLPSHRPNPVVYAPEAVVSSSVLPTAAPRRPEGSGALAAESSTCPRRRTSHQQLLRLPHSLSDRDSLILSSLSAHPFLTTGQLIRLHFADHTSAASGGRAGRRVLARLASASVIEHLERRIGGLRAGSASYVWRIGPVGERLLRLGNAMPPGTRARRKEPSLHHLDHSLSVAEAHVRLLEAGRAGRFELLRVASEPTNWRQFVGAAGERLVLKPDLSAVTAQDDFEDHWYIEVDRGTESLPTLLRKCALYAAYARSGLEQRASGVFPWVLWLMSTAASAERLTSAINASTELPKDVFRVTTFNQLVAAVAGDQA